MASMSFGAAPCATTAPVPYRPMAEALSSAVRAGKVADVHELAPFRATLGRLIPDWRDAGRRSRHGRRGLELVDDHLPVVFRGEQCRHSSCGLPEPRVGEHLVR